MASRRAEWDRRLVRDPEVTIGRLKLLQRTDGQWIAFDPARPPGEGTVRMSKDRAVVERWMHAQDARERKKRG